jgi:hypothetical protein
VAQTVHIRKHSNARDTKPFAATTAWDDYYDWPCERLEALARETRVPPALGSCQSFRRKGRVSKKPQHVQLSNIAV